MKKIFIIGPPGCGKTYLSRKISEKTGIKYFALDNIFWKDVGVYSKKEDITIRDRKFREITSSDSWIMEGSYYKWIERGLEKADQIIILKISKTIRTYGILKRSLIFRIRGERKESIYSIFKMIKWGITYDSKIFPIIFTLLINFKNKTLILKSRKKINFFLRNLS